MVKFSTDLWDGFEHISAKTELGLVVFKDVSEFAKKRAALEAEYAKKLQELCKTVPGAGMFSKAAPIDKESKTLKSAFLSWLDEGVKLAGHHQEFANKINNDVVKPLEGFIKAKDSERKKAVAEGQKRTKVFVDAKANLDKAKEAYTRTMKEAEQATEAHEKTKTELESGPEAKKKQLGENEKRAGQKASQLVEKGKAAEAAYQKAVDTANEVSKETFTTHLPPIIDTLQQLEEERYTQAKAVIESFQREFRALPDLLIERAEELAKALDSLHLESDLEEFVQEKKGTATEPEVFKFVPFKEPVAGTEEKTEEKNETTEEL